MLEYDLHEALRLSKLNSAHQWPRRDAESNRLEPECWPAIRPRFRINPEASVFTIGSCFARNIEHHLAELGMDVPAYRFFLQEAGHLGGTNAEILNRYTPPSIYQELAWTRGILDRDDEVRMEDVEPFLLELHNGKVIDLQRRPLTRFGLTRTEALSQRQLLYRLFRYAFHCDVVVVTLGLIECWWDQVYDQYIEFSGELLRHAPERFHFRRLDYPAAYQFTRSALELLNPDGKKRILLTTSPVPLQRTFTSDDVIVANGYSKSVLRAVAGQIVEDLPWVDYFPSFESIMLTKRQEVWEDDLVHVSGAFVGRVMARVMESYVGSEGPAADLSRDARLQLISLVGAKLFDEAAALYETLNEEQRAEPDFGFQVAVADLLAQLGRDEEALAILDVAKPEEGQESGNTRPQWRAAAIYDHLKQPEKAANALSRAYRSCAGQPTLLIHSVHHLRGWNFTMAIDWLAREVARDTEAALGPMHAIATILREEGRFAEAETLLRRCIGLDGSREELVAQLGAVLLGQDNQADACTVYEEYLGRYPHSRAITHQLTNLYARQQRWPDSERRLRAVVEAGNADAQTWFFLGQCAFRQGRPEEAIELVQKAIRMEPGREPWNRFLDRVQAEMARRRSQSQPAQRPSR